MSGPRRFDTHIMMGLAYGKVTQDTARLTIAQAMIKVRERQKVLGQAQLLGILCNSIHFLVLDFFYILTY